MAPITQVGRSLRGTPSLGRPEAIAAFPCDPTIDPLFARPSAGKYCLNVINADANDPPANELVPFGGAHQGGADDSPDDGRGDPLRSAALGCGCSSLSSRAGPHIHCAVAKIAAGRNRAANYWGPGDMLGVIDLSIGRIGGLVRGTGAHMIRDEADLDTGLPAIGFSIPYWFTPCDLAREAAAVFPGIRTQS